MLRIVHSSDRSVAHAIVTITEADVRAFHPCGGGIEGAVEAGLFPLVISTDPEENLDVATVIADAPRATNMFCDDAWWLLCKVAQKNYTWRRHGEIVNGVTIDDGANMLAECPAVDAWIVAQQLAVTADIIDSRTRRRAASRRRRSRK